MRRLWIRITAFVLTVVLFTLWVPMATAASIGDIGPLATIGISVTPNPYDPTSGQHLYVSWTYEDLPHETTIIIQTASGGIPYGTYGDQGRNTADLGVVNLPDGRYTVLIIPNDAPDFPGRGSFTVKRAKLHPTPTVNISELELFWPPEYVGVPIPQGPTIAAISAAELEITCEGQSRIQSSDSPTDNGFIFEVWPDKSGVYSLSARFLFTDGQKSPWSASKSFEYVARPPAPHIDNQSGLTGQRVVNIAGTISLSGETQPKSIVVTHNSDIVAEIPVSSTRWSCTLTLREGVNFIVAFSHGEDERSRSDLSNSVELYYDPYEKYVGDLDPKSACATLGGGYSSGFYADPINTATGNFTHNETDLVVFGKSPLMFQRYYNSLNPFFGALGNGWNSTYDYSLDLGSPDTVVVIRPDGRRDNYHVSGGSLVAPLGVPDSLSRGADGRYSLEAKDGQIYRFDSSGRLASVADRYGSVATVEYSDVSGVQRISAVHNQLGQSLTFGYDSRARIRLVTDNAGRQVALDYDGLDNLRSVTKPNGEIVQYRYNSLDQMTEIIDPDGTVVLKNIYDSLNRVQEQQDAAGRSTFFAYDRGNSAVTITTPDGKRIIDRYDALYRLMERTNRDGSVVSFDYDQNGYRNRVALQQGLPVAIQHDSRGNAISITGRDGAKWVMQYDSYGNLKGMLDPDSNLWRVDYGEAGRLRGFADPTGAENTYEYDERGNLKRMANSAGQIVLMDYNAQDQLQRVSDAAGVIAEYTYNALGLPETVTDGRGGVTSYKYDAMGRIASVCDATGQTTHLAYNWMDEVTSRTLPNGNVITYSYNSDGTLASVADALGRGMSYTYDCFGNILTQTDAEERTIAYAYDDAGRITSVSDAAGARVSYVYDVEGRLKEAISPRGGRTAYQCDSAGNVTTVTNPSGGTTRFGYDVRGNVIQVTDAHGLTTTICYDGANRPTGLFLPNGSTIEYEYDKAGRVARFKDQRGVWYTYGYDLRNQLLSVSDSAGRTTAFTRDAAGNISTMTDAAGNQWVYDYDLLNRLTSVLDPLGNSWAATYNDLGQVATETDPLGRMTEYEYDLGGRLQSVADPAGGVVSRSYDLTDRLTGVTDARGFTTSYGYDARGLLNAVLDPLGRSTRFDYGVDGLLASKIDPDGSVTSYDYSLAGLLTGVTYADGSEVSYGYDDAGLRLWMSDDRGLTSYSYDELCRLSAVDMPDGCRVGYGYNTTGELASINYPDGRTVTYGYDSLGRLTGVYGGGGMSTYTYDEMDRPISLTRSSGISTVRSYDAGGNLVSLANQNGEGNIVSSYSYQYDAAGQVTSVIEADGKQTSYVYDLAGRLTDANVSDGQFYSYAYDPSGNITRYVQGERDEDGLLSQKATDYEISQTGQLVSSTCSKDGNSSTTLYCYSVNGQLIQIVAPTGLESELADAESDLALAGGGKAKGGKARGQNDSSGETDGIIGEAEGSSSQGTLTSLFYDAAGRLIEVDQEAPWGQQSVIYAYDGDGNRVYLEGFRLQNGKGGRDNETAATGTDLLSQSGSLRGDKASDTPLVSSKKADKPSTDGSSNAGGDAKGSGQDKENGPQGGNGSGMGNGPDRGNKGTGDSLGGSGRGKAWGRGHGKAFGLSKDRSETIQLAYVNGLTPAGTELLATYDADGNPVNDFIYGLDRLSTIGASGASSQFLYDGFGSVRQLVDESGKVADRYRYTPYGDPVANGRLDPSQKLNTGNTFGFLGQDHDPVFGMVYLGARYYDPGLLRFAVPDPLTSYGLDVSGSSSYAYANGNPLRYYDPSGMLNEMIGKKDVLTPGAKAALLVLRGIGTAVGVVTLATVSSVATPIALTSYLTCLAFTASHAIGVANDIEDLAQGDYVDYGTDPLYDWAGDVAGVYGQLGMAALEAGAWGALDWSTQGSQIPDEALVPAADEEVALTRSQQAAVNKISNTIRDHLTEQDLLGAARDLAGNPVPNPKGGFYQHLKEVNDALTALQESATSLQGSLTNPNLNSATRATLQQSLDLALSYIERINRILGYR